MKCKELSLRQVLNLAVFNVCDWEEQRTSAGLPSTTPLGATRKLAELPLADAVKKLSLP
jgi:hypothetical protein